MLEMAESCAVFQHATALGALCRKGTRRPLLKEFRTGLRLEFRDQVASVDLA